MQKYEELTNRQKIFFLRGKPSIIYKQILSLTLIKKAVNYYSPPLFVCL